MLQRYERGNENFTSGESYRKSNKVCLQVRRTEWNITPHNQRLPDQYSSHRRDRLPGLVLLPPVCLSKREENWNPCSSSYCAQLISRTAYGGVVLAAGGFAPPPRRTGHIREIKKKVHGSGGVSQMFPLLSLGDLMMMTVSVRPDKRVTGRQWPVKGATWRSERKEFFRSHAIKSSLVSVFPGVFHCFHCSLLSCFS